MIGTAQRTTPLLPILFGAYALCGCGPNVGGLALPATYTVGGSVSGLVGSGLTLTRSGSIIGRGANGTYPNFGLGPFLSGQSYDVAVIAQPVSPSQTCVVSNGTGTIGHANVSNVQVTCTTNASRFAYVANDGSNSISTYTIDAPTGALIAVANVSVSAGIPHALAVNPQSRYLYMTNGASNNVSAYAIGAGNGALTAVGGSPFPTGNNPSSVSADPGGTLVYVTNESDGTISAYSQDPASGTLIAVAGSPFATGTNPASIAAPDFVGPLDSFIYAGTGSNNIWAYAVNFNGTTLTGALMVVPGSPFPAGSNPVSVVADLAGDFLYAANQGDGTVSAYSVDPAGGSLASVAGSPFAAGAGPASVAVDPFGRFAYVANKADGTISAYVINAGALRAVAGSPFTAGSGPSSLTVDNLGKFLYVANSGSNNVSAYTIDPTSGTLTPISGSPFASGSGPVSIAVSD
jgi:6-phosphogluconolactonase